MKMKAGIVPMSVLAAACAAALAGCASTRTHESLGQGVDDAAITSKVKAALVADPSTKARDIHVTTYRGVVELSGFVDSKAQREDAQRIAMQTAGVRHVDDQLQIAQNETVGRAVDDTGITAKVKAALLANPDTRADIEVTTHQGIVQLYGFVNSRSQRDDAAKVAMGVQGVRKVDNALQIKPAPQQ